MQKKNSAAEVHVACAVIVSGDKVLLTQRSEKMKLPLKWEFPGGKIEENENPEECIVREIREELSITVSVLQPLTRYKHYYSYSTIVLHPFICSYDGSPVVLHEHISSVWVSPGKILNYDLAAADIPAAEEFIRIFEKRKISL